MRALLSADEYQTDHIGQLAAISARLDDIDRRTSEMHGWLAAFMRAAQANPLISRALNLGR
ncbi:MAG: hypothetical protein ACREDE_09535 [Thermoplasmata archaeon]